VPDETRARRAIASLATRVDSAAVAPEEGAEGEALRPLDLSPHPGSRSFGPTGATFRTGVWGSYGIGRATITYDRDTDLCEA
jgi:hypothetical protein